jgi:hypothetical protein
VLVLLVAVLVVGLVGLVLLLTFSGKLLALLGIYLIPL